MAENPKLKYGNAKIPLHLWPETATVLGCMALQEGADKYGRGNFRATKVNVSTYVSALRRHCNSWFEGEDIDPDSGLPHLAKMLGCLAILVDSHYAGTLVDDRQYPGGYQKSVEDMQSRLSKLKELNADKTPVHYDIRNVADRFKVGDKVIDSHSGSAVTVIKVPGEMTNYLSSYRVVDSNGAELIRYSDALLPMIKAGDSVKITGTDLTGVVKSCGEHDSAVPGYIVKIDGSDVTVRKYLRHLELID